MQRVIHITNNLKRIITGIRIKHAGAQWTVLTQQIQIVLTHKINYLRFCQPERTRKFRPFRYTQVLFIPELFLQRQELLCGERCPRFPVRFVFPQVALQFRSLSV